ncbi:reverse transcriptase domain-containing protein [Tanacetum coccineum]
MITMNERCSTVLLNKLLSKEKDPRSFTIPYDIGQLHINNALADLGASISLMPYTMYEKLGLGEPKATRMSLELTDRSIQYPRGIIENVLIKVDKFVLPIDFVILDMPEDSRVPIILRGPFLATARAMIDVFNKKVTLRVGDDEVIFDVDQSIKRPPTKDDECYGVDVLDDMINAEAQELLANEEPDSFLSRGLEKSIDQSDLEGCKPEITKPVEVEREHLYSASANEIDEKKSRLKDLPHHLEYAYLHGFFQIPIAPKDQEKTTFTCPYGTFAYRMMPFGLCNAPATFQRCMTAIFHDMVEDFMKLFMDDFSVFGNSFDCCLANLDRMLARCEETNLVLNWEKCHFMVIEWIVLGHKILGARIEVDRAKIDVIAKLSYLTNVKGVRSFLGHAGFYRRFIKDFSMMSKPMTKLLMKDTEYDFSDDCKRANFAVGAVLGIDGKFKPIYYASKTLNNAQEHYTTTEKELLVDVFSFDKFRPYLVLLKIVVYIDHSALKYLFSKQDAKPRLIRWVLLLQGFDIEIKDKRGAENLAVDHLSRLENLDLGTFTEEEIDNEFPDEHLMLCPNNIMRRCVAGNAIFEILSHCHSGPTRGHHSASVTRRKVYESGFFWPSIFKDVKDYVMRCDACQRSGNISSRSEMPQNNIQMPCWCVIMEYLVKLDQKARILELKRRYFKDYCSDNQYAVSIKEDTAYLCLHSPKITKET